MSRSSHPPPPGRPAADRRSRVFATWARGRRVPCHPSRRPVRLATPIAVTAARRAGAHCARPAARRRAHALPKATQFMRRRRTLRRARRPEWRTLVPAAARVRVPDARVPAGRRKRYIRPARLVLVFALLLFAVARYALPENPTRQQVRPASTALAPRRRRSRGSRPREPDANVGRARGRRNRPARRSVRRRAADESATAASRSGSATT